MRSFKFRLRLISVRVQADCTRTRDVAFATVLMLNAEYIMKAKTISEATGYHEVYGQ